MDNPTGPESRERAFDVEVERAYWLLHLDSLPNYERFIETELVAAVALGLEATHRGTSPLQIADALMACYARLIPAPIASREDILAVMTMVWSKTANELPPARRHVIELERFGQSLLDFSPLQDVALAYVESVQGIADVRIEIVKPGLVRLTYEWTSDLPTSIPRDHMDRYGLRVAGEE